MEEGELKKTPRRGASYLWYADAELLFVSAYFSLLLCCLLIVPKIVPVINLAKGYNNSFNRSASGRMSLYLDGSFDAVL